MMLQEYINWDTYIRVPTIGRKRWVRAIRYDPAPYGMGGYNQDYNILPRDAARQRRGDLAASFNIALGYDMNAIECAVQGRHASTASTSPTTRPTSTSAASRTAHFPWAVEKMAEFAVEKALSGEPTPDLPDWKALLTR